MHPRTGEVLDAEFTRAEFETLLEQHGATREPIRRVVVKATYTGQTQMGIDIFEMGARVRARRGSWCLTRRARRGWSPSRRISSASARGSG